jgi:UDP-glucose 4-epimerase
MKRVLLTGGSGFLGSRVVRKLLAEEYSVALVLRPSSDSRRLNGLLEKCTVFTGDLSDIYLRREAIKDFSPKTVVHLAWEGVNSSNRNNVIQLKNIINSINLFNLSVELECEHFIGLGSQAEYGPISGRIVENTPCRPTTLYGTSKMAVYLALDRAAKSIGKNFSWMRLFSSYGPDDDPNWLIPYVIRSLLNGDLPKLTQAEQNWDYIFIDDVADAVVAVVKSLATGVFNIGSGRAYPLRKIIERARDMIDPNLPLGFGEIAYRADQVMHLESDISALFEATGWRPKTDLDLGLSKTIEWYKTQNDNQKNAKI